MNSPQIDRLLDEGLAMQRQGALGKAVDCYLLALQGDPGNATALYRYAQVCCQLGQFSEAVGLLRRALAAEPNRPSLHVLLGRALTELGAAQDALASFDQAIELDAGHADAHGARADLLVGLGRPIEAIDGYRCAIAIQPRSFVNWTNLGATQAELGRFNDARASFDQALALEPESAEAHFNRGSILNRIGQREEALQSLDRTLSLSPNHVPGLVLFGDAKRALGDNISALASYERALSHEPHSIAAMTGRAAALAALDRPAEALADLDVALALTTPNADMLSNRAFLLHALDRDDEALLATEKALELEQNHPGALENRGVALSALSRHTEAIACYRRALAASPNDARTYINLSKAEFDLGRYDEALVNADHALAIDKAHVEALYARGLALNQLRRHKEAISAFRQILQLAPDHRHALASLATSYLSICAWDQCEGVTRTLYEGIANGAVVAPPYGLIQLSAPATVMWANVKQMWEREFRPVAPLDIAATDNGGGKIRIGYLSGDFRSHATSYLMSELFECHDRTRFEIIGLSCGPDDHSAIRSRVVKAFDHFYDLESVSDREAAIIVRRLGIDVLVDLGGHTSHARLGILQHRPAPIQVNYLVYPGTVGGNCIDYIIGDPIVLPFDQQPYYSEKIVHLPDCYQVNDSKRLIGPDTPTRLDAGLPPEGLVLCCFNNSYKISKSVFDVWMRLLHDVPGSVLWLLRDNADAHDTLMREASARNIDPKRLIFAARCSQADHLARHRLADLFLDTPGYNAHTTASDALWAGLPVLTCIGSTFAGRVAASLLQAIGLPDMVTDSLSAYESRALELARDPALLAEVRERLSQNRLTHPLFNTDRFARNIERAYETMFDIYRGGQHPKSFSIPSTNPVVERAGGQVAKPTSRPSRST